MKTLIILLICMALLSCSSSKKAQQHYHKHSVLVVITDHAVELYSPVDTSYNRLYSKGDTVYADFRTPILKNQ